MRLAVSTLFQHKLQFLFSYVLAIFARGGLHGIFCAAINRKTVSLFKLPFHSHVQVFWCAILPVCCLKYSNSSFFLLLFSSFCYFSFSSNLIGAHTGCCNLYFSGPCIDVSTHFSVLASFQPPNFLDTHIVYVIFSIAQSVGAVEYTDLHLCRGVRTPQRVSFIGH